jgi:hypothetical protein
MMTWFRTLSRKGDARPATDGQLSWHRIFSIGHEVWPEVGKLIRFGILFGLILIPVGEYLAHAANPEHSPFGTLTAWQVLLLSAGGPLLRELGTALLISAVAIFGYEFVRHVSGIIEQERALNKEIDLIERAYHKPLLDDWEHNVRCELCRLFKHEGLADALLEPIGHARSIYLRKERQPAQHQYDETWLNFLCDLVKTNMTPISGAVAQYHERIVARDDTPWGAHYEIPDARDISGNVLVMLLSSLNEGDSYKSVSNICFYDDALMSKLRGATETACAKGITIYRLFDLSSLNIEDAAPSDETFNKCKRLLNEHFALAEKVNKIPDGGRYHIRFFGKGLKEEMVLPNFNPKRSSHLNEVPGSYFGLFCHRDDNTSLLFVAEEPQRASCARLAYCKQDDATQAFFDEMWRVTRFVRNPFAGAAFDRRWLVDGINELRASTTPHRWWAA